MREKSLGSTFKPETLTLKDEAHAKGTCQEDTNVRENILHKGKRRKLKGKPNFRKKCYLMF
ncbi:hypothetical protein X777_05319 [Ooceraea biroi]|uniref:Uncharacterized protein n=1 Tax=Ooceraea biroi TaxID=2015173 RepID=A0A026WGH2_OOCBI|nr:hypothetical protein X777_05319 [Ooceraea biroi]